MKKIVLILIVLILAIIPFFWLKPGEINLGGDSSRLYFYDPISYLKTFPLYNIAPGQLGELTISYFFIPFTLFLAFLKIFFTSTWMLISAFHSLMLVIAFISVYLIAIEFSKSFKVGQKNLLFLAAIASGLFYIFAPAFGGNWDKAIISHNQFFLNPLVFYLILRYLNTKNIRYLLFIILITFIFSVNFSFIASPPFFAFYPIAFLYFFLYALFIKKTSVSWKIISGFIILFVWVQFFHFFPQIALMFDKSSNSYLRVFSKGSISDALQYFSGIYPGIRLSNNLLALPQPLSPFYFLFIIYPLVLISGLLHSGLDKSKVFRKNFLLLFIFFLIALFFDTGNVTSFGISFYKWLFLIPGFGMFRNFYGQFMYVFYFFYALVFGQALYYVLIFLKKRVILFYFLIIAVLLINAWPFIRGDMVNLPVYQTKNVRVPFKMDSNLEKALQFLKNDPNDVKILTLPLTDFGYQMFSGIKGGLYIGPSSIGYLTGKKDFPGAQGFGPYSDLFLNLVQNKDYQQLQNLFSLLNIQYIFYNSDPYVYNNFPQFPYNTMKKYFPSQKSIFNFIKNLEATEIFESGYYSIYKLKENTYLPHFYPVANIVYSNNSLMAPFFLKTDLGLRIFKQDDYKNDKGEAIFFAENKSPYSLLKDNSHLNFYEAFTSINPGNIFYPFILIREQFTLRKSRKDPDKYIEAGIFDLSKRIVELGRWGKELKILHNNSFKQPKLWEFYSFGSWEAVLGLYRDDIEKLRKFVDSQSASEGWKEAKKIKINEQVLLHKERVIETAKNLNKDGDDKDKDYLLHLIKDEFDTISKELTLGKEKLDPSLITYDIKIPPNQRGIYEFYIKRPKGKNLDFTNAYMEIGGEKIKPKNLDDFGELVYFGNVNFEKQDLLNFKLYLPGPDILEGSKWESSGNLEESDQTTLLTANNLVKNNAEGFMKDISWKHGQYLITFDYKTFGDDFSLRIFDRYLENSEMPLKDRIILERNLNSFDWKTHQTIFNSDEWTVSGIVQVIQNNSKKNSQILLKNFKIVEILDSSVIFKKISEVKNSYETPKISFTKINPTKYKVDVFGAYKSYILVFSELFNKDWRVYVKDLNNNSRSFNTFVSLTIGKLSKLIFSGIDPNLFETQNYKEISQNNHFLVNGYANAWQIVPKDVGGRKDYSLIVEVKNQELFYQSMTFSIIGVCVVLGLLIFSIVSKHKKH